MKPEERAKCGKCNGALTKPEKRKCFMTEPERGWDWWVKCEVCNRGFYGYEPEAATKRCEAKS